MTSRKGYISPSSWSPLFLPFVSLPPLSLRIEAEAQLLRTAEARRKRKLLEILREKRLTEWTVLRDKEDEQAAADSWLSRYAAERYTTENVPPPPG